MGSLYLNGLNKEARATLEKQLWDSQGGKCFISGKPIELALDQVDIDHIIPTRDNGPDNPSNFPLTLAHYNRSKQAADLRVARVLARFEFIKEEADSDDRGANLNDVLKAYGGAKEPLRAKIEGDTITCVVGPAEKVTVPNYTDKLSGMRYFFSVLPIRVVYHDDRINPRPLGANLRGLVEEFHKRRPQLHVSLGWMNSAELPDAKINLFDGQHILSLTPSPHAPPLPLTAPAPPSASGSARAAGKRRARRWSSARNRSNRPSRPPAA
jgi:hypothetical protein